MMMIQALPLSSPATAGIAAGNLSLGLAVRVAICSGKKKIS